jgi:hypothetical protein
LLVGTLPFRIIAAIPAPPHFFREILHLTMPINRRRADSFRLTNKSNAPNTQTASERICTFVVVQRKGTIEVYEADLDGSAKSLYLRMRMNEPAHAIRE